MSIQSRVLSGIVCLLFCIGCDLKSPDQVAAEALEKVKKIRITKARATLVSSKKANMANVTGSESFARFDHYSSPLCALGADAQAIVKEEAAALKKKSAAGLLRYSLSRAVMCLSGKALGTEGIKMLQHLHEDEPSVSVRVLIARLLLGHEHRQLKTQSGQSFELTTYLIKHVHLDELKASSMLKSMLVRGPITGVNNIGDLADLEPQRVLWCKHIAPAVAARFANPQKFIATSVDTLDRDLFGATVIEHFCGDLALTLLDNLWDAMALYGTVNDAVYAFEKKKKRDEFKARAIAERAEVDLRVSKAAKKMASLIPVGSSDETPYDRHQTWHQGVTSNQALLLSMHRGMFNRADRAWIAQIQARFFAKKRSCTQHALILNALKVDRRRRRSTIFDDFKAQLWKKAPHCPYTYTRIESYNATWFDSKERFALQQHYNKLKMAKKPTKAAIVASDLGDKKALVPRLVPGRPKIRGALDKAIIRRVVRKHRNEIRSCYEMQLQKNARLAGQVKIKFTIAGTGRVISAIVSSSSLKNSSVERCMTRKVRRWVFPKPKGGGIVIVTYPFGFSS